jgi:hypothetical protein
MRGAEICRKENEMTAERNRGVLRDELGKDEVQSFEDILRAFGRDECDAKSIVLRVSRFLDPSVDLQVRYNRRDRPQIADWYELIVALAEQQMHELPKEIVHSEDHLASGPYSPDDAEALEKVYPDKVFHKFNSGPCFATIRFVLCQANRLVKGFPTPPMPESDGRLSVEKTREYLSQISGWALSRINGSDDPERDAVIALIKGPIPKGLLKLIWRYRNKGKQPVNLGQVWQETKGSVPDSDQTIHSGLKVLQKQLSHTYDQHGLVLTPGNWRSDNWTLELIED